MSKSKKSLDKTFSFDMPQYQPDQDESGEMPNKEQNDEAGEDQERDLPEIEKDESVDEPEEETQLAQILESLQKSKDQTHSDKIKQEIDKACQSLTVVHNSK